MPGSVAPPQQGSALGSEGWADAVAGTGSGSTVTDDCWDTTPETGSMS